MIFRSVGTACLKQEESKLVDKPVPEMIRYKGLSINSGVVAAKACLYSQEKHRQISDRVVQGDKQAKTELARFERSLKQCSADLQKIADEVAQTVGKAESEIFITQMHIMNDPAIVDSIKEKVIRDGNNIERAITDVLRSYEEKFASLDYEYLRDRSTDIGEIRRRLLDNLYNTRPGFVCEGQRRCTRGSKRIIVAEELTADMMVHMDLEKVLGIVTEHGGISSHAAIIARSVGVPAVSGVRGIFRSVACGTEMLVDGDAGEVITSPTPEILASRKQVDPVDSKDVCLIETPVGLEVMANASILEDVRQAAAVRADGIGLFRTEILFMRAERLISEDDQFEHYAEVLRIMEGKPVTVRLLDIGGDKELPFLSVEKESNPYLGWRGARFLLGNPTVFTTQVRALVRLSKVGKVRILFPMVIDVNQLRKLCDAVRAIMATEDGLAENISLGAMFEVPSACLQADQIYKHIDFASIGSNDLIQYLFAVDRNNELVSQDYDPEHPLLWSILEQLSDAAQRARKPLSICGEMAGRVGFASRLVGLNIKSLSVSPRLIPRVRNEISQMRDESLQSTSMS